MNLHRGFHRLFIILWVLYMGAILFWPFYEAKRQTDTAIDVASVAHKWCLDDRARANGGLNQDDDFKICEAKRQKELQDMNVGPWMVWKDTWRTLGWHLLWFVPAVLLIPPLIVYVILRLLLRASLWVAGSFRESPT